jgi:hypothetical protein
VEIISPNYPWNKVRLQDHLPQKHSQDYHTFVFDRLGQAVSGKSGNPYRHALQQELFALKHELQTPGSQVRQLLFHHE